MFYDGRVSLIVDTVTPKKRGPKSVRNLYIFADLGALVSCRAITVLKPRTKVQHKSPRPYVAVQKIGIANCW